MTTSTRTKPKSEAKPAAEAPTTPLTGKAKEDYDKRVAAQSKPAPKRKVYTPEERIAKLEAELAVAREVRSNRAKVQVAQLKVQRAKLDAKRDELNTKIEEVDAAIKAVVPATDEEKAEADASVKSDETVDAD